MQADRSRDKDCQVKLAGAVTVRRYSNEDVIDITAGLRI